MLPTIDFTQQLAQLQAQLQNMNYVPQYAPTSAQGTPSTNYCQFRLPCGLCSKTNSFCGMQTTEVTCSNEVKADG